MADFCRSVGSETVDRSIKAKRDGCFRRWRLRRNDFSNKYSTSLHQQQTHERKPNRIDKRIPRENNQITTGRSCCAGRALHATVGGF
jgi:hypothetical protein